MDSRVLYAFSQDFFRGVFSHLAYPAQFRRLPLDLTPDAMHLKIKQRGGEWLVDI